MNLVSVSIYLFISFSVITKYKNNKTPTKLNGTPLRAYFANARSNPNINDQKLKETILTILPSLLVIQNNSSAVPDDSCNGTCATIAILPRASSTSFLNIVP